MPFEVVASPNDLENLKADQQQWRGLKEHTKKLTQNTDRRHQTDSKRTSTKGSSSRMILEGSAPEPRNEQLTETRRSKDLSTSESQRCKIEEEFVGL